MNEVLAPAQTTDPELAVTAALAELGLSPCTSERRERMVCLRLTEAGMTTLADAETRRSLVTRLEAAGVRYTALDLVPLANGAEKAPASRRIDPAG
jgi:hypothetical protein